MNNDDIIKTKMFHEKREKEVEIHAASHGMH